MNIQTAVKYRIWDSKRPLMIYYGIIYAILALVVITTITVSNASISIGGIEFSSMIFIFIFGLNSFKETFRMFLQNGLSRMTLFKSFALGIIPIVALMAAVDSINSLWVSLAINYDSMFSQFYSPRYAGAAGNAVQYIEGFLWYLFAYAMVAMLGLFITTLYYRMDKIQKLVVSIGTPVLFIFVLPMVDANFTNGAIYKGIAEFFAFAWGYTNGFNPYYSMITCAVFFALFGGFAYLLMRKAVVHN